MKKSLRDEPVSGTVISIPLRSGIYIYAVKVYNSSWWMYDFISNVRTNDKSFFVPLRWYKYFINLDDGIGSDTVDECRVELGVLEDILPATWRKLPQWVVDHGDAPTQYKVEKFTPGITQEPWYVKEDELALIQENKVCAWSDFIKFAETLLPQLERINLNQDQLSHPIASSPVASFTPGCIYEVWLSNLNLMKISDLEEIGEEIDDELEKHEAGEVIGMGGTVGQDHHNIAVRSGPGKDKQALACIRCVLKRLNANPETTDITIQGESGNNLGLE